MSRGESSDISYLQELRDSRSERILSRLEPEARYLLEAMRLNTFENCLNAIECFLTNIELFDSVMTFDRATHTFDYAIAAFAKMDQDHDKALSLDEIKRYSQHVDKDVKERLEWLVLNGGALSRASLVADHRGHISRQDLEKARDVFRGLSHLQRHFEKIARDHGDGKPGITENDILEYLFCHHLDLSTRERECLRELIVYLRRLECTSSPEQGLKRDDLPLASPNRLWPDPAKTQPSQPPGTE